MNHVKTGIAVVSGTPDTVMEIVVESYHEAGFSIKNSHGSVALDAFEVYAKFYATGPEVLLASIAGDYSTPVYPLRRAGPLVTLGVGIAAPLFMSVEGIHTLIFKASGNGAASQLDIHGQIT